MESPGDWVQAYSLSESPLSSVLALTKQIPDGRIH